MDPVIPYEQDIIIEYDERYITVDTKLKDAINLIMEVIEEDGLEKRIKAIKTLLSVKFDLKLSVPKDNKVMDNILCDMFGKKYIRNGTNSASKLRQKKYYETHKDEIKNRYRENAESIKEYERKKYRERMELLKEIHNSN